MRKKAVGIIGGIVLVAALGAAAFVLLKNDPGEESSSDTALEESSSGVVVTLTEQEPSDVTSIDITNASGSFEVVRVKEATDSEDAAYAIAGWEDLPMDTSVLWTLSNNTASMSSTDLVAENCDDMAKYGLDEENAVAATLHFADGSSYAFRIGSAISGAGVTYLAPADENTVYTVSTSLVSNFSKSAMDFLSKTVVEEPAEEDYPIINSLTVERDNLNCTLELVYDKTAEEDENLNGTIATHIMSKPVPAYLSVDRSTPVVTGIFGLTADAVAVPHPTDADLEEAGLNQPFGTVTMDCDDGNTYVLHMSSRFTDTDEETGAETAYYYIYLDGVDAIYQVAEENLVWSTVTPTDVASKLVFSTYVWDISNLDVRMGDKTLDFDITATDASDAVVQVNGKDTDAERYRLFYTFLLNTTAETIDWESQPQGDALAEITIQTANGNLDRTFAFYALDEFTCLMTVDGQPAFTCRKSYLDVLEKNIDLYDTNEEFIKTWS